MTNPKPLSKSPLNLIRHEFRVVEARASRSEDPKGGFALHTSREVLTNDDSDREFLLVLKLKFGPQDGVECPYSGEIEIEGEFEVSENYPKDKAYQLVRITGASMLYGACREMLANLTARSVHGMISLPSVSFVPPTESAKGNEGTQRPAAKKRRAIDRPRD